MRVQLRRFLMRGFLSRSWFRPSVVFAVVAIGVLVSFAVDWRRADVGMQMAARERGAALFRFVMVTRDWNVGHGGVYVPITAITQPNPWLEHDRRDVVTQEGFELTMVNEAIMTRQLAEIARQSDGIQIHLTSLRLLRPANRADAWEAEALRRFEAGLSEIVELIPGEVPVHRYMAPLKVTEPCLACHQRQDYKVGLVRGGISITMPSAQLLEIRDAARIRSGMIHLLMFAVISALLQLLVSRTRSHLQALEDLAKVQEYVIAERTRDLSHANTQLEGQLAASELAAAVFHNAAEAIIVTDDQGKFLQVNPAFALMTGYDASEILGVSAGILKSGRHPPEFYAEMWQSLKHEGRWQGEIWNRRKNAELFIVWLSINRVAHAGQPEHFVATLTDITRSKQLEEELRHRAYHDPLTDLPNRALFADRLQVAFLQAQRHGRSLALCSIDLDNFKPVNDTFGHAAGDELLVETARRLRFSMRAADTVARLGGDEFAAILTDVGSRAEVEEVAARIVADLGRPFDLNAGTARISCSIGIALFPEHGMDVEELQRSADIALYAVKNSTRNAYRIGVKDAAGRTNTGASV